MTLDSTAAQTPLLSKVSFKVGVVSETLQVTEYIVGSASYTAPEFQHTFGSGQRHPLIAALNNLLAQVPYLNYATPLTDSDLYSNDVRRGCRRGRPARGQHERADDELRPIG